MCSDGNILVTGGGERARKGGFPRKVVGVPPKPLVTVYNVESKTIIHVTYNYKN